MSDEQIAEAVNRLERARAELLGTGELHNRAGGGRAPARSDAFHQARNNIHIAEQARNRLLVELVGDSDTVSIELAERLSLTGREAASILATARTGTQRMREHTFGDMEDHSG